MAGSLLSGSRYVTPSDAAYRPVGDPASSMSFGDDPYAVALPLVKTNAAHYFADTAVVFAFALAGYAIASAAIRAVVCRRLGRPPEYAARIVSAAHGVITILLAGSYFCGVVSAIAFNAFHQLAPLTEATTMAQAMIMAHSIAYFFVDLVYMWLDEGASALFVAHHFAAITALLYSTAAATDGCGGLIVTILSVMEATNPFQHGQWILVFEAIQQEKEQQSRVARAAISSKPVLDVCLLRESDTTTSLNQKAVIVDFAAVWASHAFYLSFTLVRGVLGPLFLSLAWLPRVPPIMQFLAVCFYLGSLKEVANMTHRHVICGDRRWSV